MQTWKEADSTLASLAKTAATVGAVAAGALALGVAESIKKATEFQKSMTMVHTQAGAWNEDLNKMGSAVLSMSKEVGIGATQLADGLYHIESAGFRGTQALDMLRQSAELAKIGNAGLEITTQAVIGTMAAFADQNMTAAQAAGQLNAIVGTGDMRMEQLAKAIATGILPAADTFGLKLVDVGAALATLTDNVTPADEAATRLRMSFSLLGAPSLAATKALQAVGLSATEAQKAVENRASLEKYGVHLTQLASDLRQPNGLLVAIGDLKKHLDDAGLSADAQAAVISRAFGGGRTSAGIMTLLTEFDRFQSKYPAINAGARDFAKAWAETQQTFAQSYDRLKANLEATSIQLGSALLPLATTVVNALNAGLPGMQGFADGVQHVADVLGKLGSGKINIAQALFDGLRALGVDLPTAAVVADRAQSALEKLGHAAQLAAPYVKDLANWVKNELGQALHDLFPSPVMDVVEAIGTGLVEALKFAHDHGKELKPIVEDLIGGFLILKGVMLAGAILQFAAAFGVVAAEEGGLVAVTRALGIEYVATGAKAVGAAFTAVVAWMSSVVETAAIASMYAAQWVAANVRAAASFVLAKVTAVANAIEIGAAAVAQGVRAAAAWVASTATAIAGFVAQKVAAIASALETAAVWVASNALMALATARVIAQMILLNTWGIIVKLATLAWTAAQWLLNVALSANPIGLVIIAIALLTAGIIWAYKNVGWFHDFVDRAWSLLKQFGSWIAGTLWPIIQKLGGDIAQLGRQIADGLGSGIHDGIKTLLGILNGFIQAIDKLPGVSIPQVHPPGFAQGGTLPALASGGVVQLGGGFKTAGAMAIVGEGDGHEYVIPAGDRRYRQNAVNLWLQAGRDMDMLACGGVVGSALGGGLGGTQMGAVPTSGWGGQCVVYAENVLGVHWPVAAAKQLTAYVNSNVARAGEAAVFTGGPYGHVAVVTGPESGGSFPVIDSNWVGPEMIGRHMMSRGQYGFSGFIDTGRPGIAGLAGSIGGLFDMLGALSGAASAAMKGAHIPAWMSGFPKAVLDQATSGVSKKFGFDSGGLMPPGSGAFFNGTGGDERVLTPAQDDRLVNVLEKVARTGDPAVLLRIEQVLMRQEKALNTMAGKAGASAGTASRRNA